MENKKIFTEERQEKIIAMLKEQKKLLVNDLCEVFEVSPATIRSDLNYLEKLNLLKRTHGGAILDTKIGFEPNSNQKAYKNSDEKLSIAKFAADMIENGDTIAIDTGTTTMKLAEQLNNKKDVTVVTTDLCIANLLENYSGINVVIAGGQLRSGFSCTVGGATIAFLSEIKVDKVFLATNAVSADGILSTPALEQASVKKSLIKMGAERILLCDSSKFGTNSFAGFGTLNDIDTVVTDSGISPVFLEQYKKFNTTFEVT